MENVEIDDSEDGHRSSERDERGIREPSLTEVVTEFPTIVSQEVTKQYITLVAGVFIAIGIGLALPYALFSMTGLTDSITGGGSIAGGAVLLSLFGIVPLFGSLLVAVVMGQFVGTQLDDVRYGIVASGVGSYLGFVGMVLALVVATQFADTTIVTSMLSIEIGSLLQELIVAGVGVAIAGGGGGYLGYKMSETLRPTERADTPTGENVDGLIAAVKSIPLAVKEEQVQSGIKVIAAAFGMVGLGYGAMVVALGWIAGDVLAVLLTFIASYSVLFSAPFLAVYLGMKIGELLSMRDGVATGFVGGFVGFVVLTLAMTVFGSFGPSAGALEAFDAAEGATDGDVGAVGSGLLTAMVGLLPYAYEVSRVVIIGGIGTGIAGGLAAFSIEKYGGDDR